jgi:hypothetical protein
MYEIRTIVARPVPVTEAELKLLFLSPDSAHVCVLQNSAIDCLLQLMYITVFIVPIDRLCGLVVRVPGCRPRGPGF